MRTILTAAVACVLALTLAAPARAQQRRARPASDAELRALRQEVEALRDGQEAIRAELEEIKRLLRELAASGGARRQPTVSVDDDPALGESTAKVVLIDFSDYQ